MYQGRNSGCLNGGVKIFYIQAEEHTSLNTRNLGISEFARIFGLFEFNNFAVLNASRLIFPAPYEFEFGYAMSQVFSKKQKESIIPGL